MTLHRLSSPHAVGNQSVQRIMLTVWAATLPGFVALVVFFGWGYLLHAIIGVVTALLAEALVLLLRRRPLTFYLLDGSALLTAWLLVLALPPMAPWWVTVTAVFTAIVFAKHLYGGLGFNPFNPAMIGFALVLIAFPVEMTTRWATPDAYLTDSHSFYVAWQAVFGQLNPLQVDAFTMATPLDVYKNNIAARTQAEVLLDPVFAQGYRAYGWEWVSLLYLCGGLFLIYRNIITWHTPITVLVALASCAILFSWDADVRVPLSLHLLGGATILGAFFIATDPVSSATSKPGKLIYGAGIGVFIYVIRTWGNYPDAVAFAVLLMNFAAPLIDYFVRPKAYGETNGGGHSL
ncbi:RnfABCDGE type electron transport complex subunit D [Salinispirillum marinum]|uniref:Ion-translocating oxidoreductase complex subunit D n=2 Tax=Saccharospirillaceae TaxID=255527 RepID=A0ABV8BI43_9GAMM